MRLIEPGTNCGGFETEGMRVTGCRGLRPRQTVMAKCRALSISFLAQQCIIYFIPDSVADMARIVFMVETEQS
jgi:hypothetical protein